MRQKGYKNSDFAGCENTLVTVFAPVCFNIDINLCSFYYSRFV